MKLRSRTLEATLLLFALLNKPRSWILLTVFFVCIGAFNEVSKIPGFYLEHRNTIWSGMLNPEISFHEKLFVVSVLLLFAAVASMFLQVAMRAAIQRYVRFSKKPEL